MSALHLVPAALSLSFPGPETGVLDVSESPQQPAAASTRAGQNGGSTIVGRNDYAVILGWNHMHVHRVHTCPACGRSIGDPRQDPDVMWLEDHLYYDHDAEDFPP